MTEVEANDRMHTPVLLSEVVEYLKCPLQREEFAVVVDGTLGGGGHSEAILEMNSNVFLIGIDRDQEAVARTTTRLARFQNRVLLREGNYADLGPILNLIWPEILGKSARNDSKQVAVQAILLDLGLSSFQLTDPARGFSFRQSAPLDMRFSKNQSLTAAHVLNNFSQQELLTILRQGGVRKGAVALSREIVRRRPLETTNDLTTICEDVLHDQRAKRGAHPATVVFQAIRVMVNDELDCLKRLLITVPTILAPKGRLAIICFQSLEDEVVTRVMRSWERGSVPPPKLPVPETRGKLGKLLTKSATAASSKEVAENPRARSARLRVFERSANDKQVLW